MTIPNNQEEGELTPEATVKESLTVHRLARKQATHEGKMGCPQSTLRLPSIFISHHREFFNMVCGKFQDSFPLTCL
jgi:hypothetical protein